MTDLELARLALRRIGLSPETLAGMGEREIASTLSGVLGAFATFTSTLAAGIATIGVAPGRRAHKVDPTGIAALLRAFADTLEHGREGDEIEQVVAALAEEVRVGD